MIIEGSGSPPNEDPCSEEVELGLAALFEEETRAEPDAPTGAAIDEEGERDDRRNSQEPDEQQEYLNNVCGKKILQLKGNSIPRGLVPLEKLFDPNDVAKDPQLVPNCEDVEEVSIGTEAQPMIIKLSRTLSLEAKQKYIALMKEYADVFAWSYSDLKA